MAYCINCGHQLPDDSHFCPYCGTKVTSFKSNSENNLPNSDTTPTECDISVTVPKTPDENENSPASTDIEPISSEETPKEISSNPEAPSSLPLSKKELKKQKKQKKQGKPSKKSRFKSFVKLLIILAVICGILAGLWFTFGNMITLTIHSKDVVKTISSGSLDLKGNENPYAELPDYIKNMISDKSLTQEIGPVTSTILPYVRAEKKSVHGFFGRSSVEYTITAPDVETWLLNYPMTDATTETQILADMAEYVKTAPTRTVDVTINYYKDGFFSADWRGNYKTREFVDAICGGMNSAYNKKYQEALDELGVMFE